MADKDRVKRSRPDVVADFPDDPRIHFGNPGDMPLGNGLQPGMPQQPADSNPNEDLEEWVLEQLAVMAQMLGDVEAVLRTAVRQLDAAEEVRRTLPLDWQKTETMDFADARRLVKRGRHATEVLTTRAVRWLTSQNTEGGDEE